MISLWAVVALDSRTHRNPELHSPSSEGFWTRAQALTGLPHQLWHRAFRVRVYITSRGWDPWTERPLPEVVHVAYPRDCAGARLAHCHLDLRQLYGRLGKQQEAHAHLTTTTIMCREMDMQFWVEQAEAK